MLEAPTTTTLLRNIFFIRISYPHHMFIPHLTNWTQQHFFSDQPPWHLTVSSWLRAHLSINECGVLRLQIRWHLILMLDIHPFYKVYGLFGFNNFIFFMINSWKVHPLSIIFFQVFVMRFSTFSKSSKSLLNI
jgi:hypothetical protein